MRFTEREIARMIEFIQWGIDKGVKDSDLNSALAKLVDMRNRSSLSIKYQQREKKNGVSTQEQSYNYLNKLSEETKEFVIAEVEAGKKNRYHSIHAIIKIKMDKGVLMDIDTEREMYLHGKRVKNVMPDHEANLIELFEYCYERLAKDYEPKEKGNEENTGEYFGYLDCVSQEAKEFVINRVHNGNKNVYHSIMAVLNNRIRHKTVEPLEEEYAFYLKKAKKHDFTETELPYVREIFEYCYAKEQERKM